MANKNISISRDKVYVGEVIKTDRIYQYADDYKDIMTNESMGGKLGVSSWFSCRSILFTPNLSNLSYDLLYKSPNYPILNITDNDECLKAEVVIKDAYNISELLKYFNYDEKLNLSDFRRIRKQFFKGDFGYNNCELFGMSEDQPEDWTYYRNNKKVTDPKELKKLIREKKIDQKLGHRSFGSNGKEHPLPLKMMDVLNDRGNNSILDILNGFDEKIDVFKPSKREGKIKIKRR